VVSAALAFVACSCGVLGLAAVLPVPARRSLARVGSRRRRPSLVQALAAVGASTVRKASTHGVEQRIVAAGRPAGVVPRELMAAKVGGAIVAAPLAASIGAVAPGRLGVLLVVVLPVAGFFMPDFWLARRASARARAARVELPPLLDLLRVTVGAGVGLAAALQAVGERGGGPLASEWCALGREVALGVPLAEAIAGMAVRLPLPEVEALSRALDAQAADARSALGRRVREDAARAGPKIQLVVALLLVPSVLLLVAAALISALAGSGGGVPIEGI
jgi:tight adherence protein C